MITKQLIWKNGNWEQTSTGAITPQLILVFGSRPTIEASPDYYKNLNSLYPSAQVLTSSTAGNIISDQLVDEAIIATAVEFEKTGIKTGVFELGLTDDKTLGENIANYFNTAGLANILLFSCSGINAGHILEGINSVLKGSVPVSGGVAGDDTRFQKTLVGLNEQISDKQLVAVATYGAHIRVSHGSKGGWDAFGPRRKVTKSQGNVLYEVDNKPVLNIYKEYLGEKAVELPGAALLFPFAIIDAETGEQIVRGVQNIDEANNAIILYGDVHDGEILQLMRCDFDRLIDGAADSAKETFLKNPEPPELAVLISCVARRLVLGQLTEEELTETRKIFGNETTLCGFYSYTELSPVVGDNACRLHNQTMTITTFSEV